GTGRAAQGAADQPHAGSRSGREGRKREGGANAARRVGNSGLDDSLVPELLYPLRDGARPPRRAAEKGRRHLDLKGAPLEPALSEVEGCAIVNPSFLSFPGANTCT